MYDQMLLTGATGALGPALAVELARRGAARRIAVMLRGEGPEIGLRFARWRNVVGQLIQPDEQGMLERFFPVHGDICQAGLGLGDEELLKDTDLVVHAAADTNFSSPHETLREVNVEGTRRMLEWSEKCAGLKRLLLVSSVFVAGSRTGRIAEDITDETPDFVTYYQRTKWEAEHVALRSGLPVGVARVSMVLGSHATGCVQSTGAVHSLIKWFARGLVPFIPSLPSARGDVIATETAAECVARMTVADWPVGERPICHIAAGEDAPKMSELIEFVYQVFAGRPAWFRRRIPQPQLVEREDFDRILATVDTSGHAKAAQALRSINRFLPDLLFPKMYDTTKAEALLGGPLPRYDWQETMARVIHFCFPPDK